MTYWAEEIDERGRKWEKKGKKVEKGGNGGGGAATVLCMLEGSILCSGGDVVLIVGWRAPRRMAPERAEIFHAPGTGSWRDESRQALVISPS